MRAALFLLALAALWLSACATAPPAPAPAAEAGAWMALLPPESTVFAVVEVPLARPLLDQAARRAMAPGSSEQSSERGTRAVLDRTQRVYAGLSLAPDAQASFSLVARGRFAAGAIRSRLACASDWRRRRAPGAAGRGGRASGYFEHRRLGLQVAAPERGLVLAANGSIAQGLDRYRHFAAGAAPAGVGLPGQALAAVEGAALFAYLPALPRGMGQPPDTGSAGGGPTGSAAGIRDLWFAAAPDPPAPGAYQAEAVFRLEQERSPRALESLFRLLLASWLRRSGLADPVGRLRRAQILAEAGEVRVRGLSLSVEELLQFLDPYLPARPEQRP